MRFCLCGRHPPAGLLRASSGKASGWSAGGKAFCTSVRISVARSAWAGVRLSSRASSAGNLGTSSGAEPNTRSSALQCSASLRSVCTVMPLRPVSMSARNCTEMSAYSASFSLVSARSSRRHRSRRPTALFTAASNPMELHLLCGSCAVRGMQEISGWFWNGLGRLLAAKQRKKPSEQMQTPIANRYVMQKYHNTLIYRAAAAKAVWAMQQLK